MFEINGFSVKEMTSIPAGDNPFCHDHYHMGVGLGKNVVVMYDEHQGVCSYVIIVDKDTGKRVKIVMEGKVEGIAAQVMAEVYGDK